MIGLDANINGIPYQHERLARTKTWTLDPSSTAARGFVVARRGDVKLSAISPWADLNVWRVVMMKKDNACARNHPSSHSHPYSIQRYTSSTYRIQHPAL
jgi:hypothetical protein